MQWGYNCYSTSNSVFCACQNMFEIPVRIIHHDTHMNLTVSDWFLHVTEVSIIV